MNQELVAPVGKYNKADWKLIVIQAVVAIIQTYLVGLKVEQPIYAPIIQIIATALGQLAV